MGEGEWRGESLRKLQCQVKGGSAMSQHPERSPKGEGLLQKVAEHWRKGRPWTKSRRPVLGASSDPFKPHFSPQGNGDDFLWGLPLVRICFVLLCSPPSLIRLGGDRGGVWEQRGGSSSQGLVCLVASRGPLLPPCGSIPSLGPWQCLWKLLPFLPGGHPGEQSAMWSAHLKLT